MERRGVMIRMETMIRMMGKKMMRMKRRKKKNMFWKIRVKRKREKERKPK